MRFFLDLGLNGARRARDVRRWRNRVVSVSDCVNYNGFGYRRDAFHPLHRYLFDCEARGLVAARRAFVEFLRFYRPCDAAQALGLAPLDKEYPLFFDAVVSFRARLVSTVADLARATARLFGFADALLCARFGLLSHRAGMVLGRARPRCVAQPRLRYQTRHFAGARFSSKLMASGAIF